MYRLRVFYRKQGMARFISEKNFHRVVERVLRRMELPLKFTEGFSPHPRISFGYPLPIGIAGTNEVFDILLIKKIDITSFLERSKNLLPEGIDFISGRWIDIKAPSIGSIETFARYIIEVSEDIDVEYLKEMGRIIEYIDRKITMQIRINNFSHKELIKLLLEGKIKSITREIL
ncbi:MAG: TIGR03936 family radical SAM-associated protein [Candidatus Ratteibacteria bacterium]|nr:TIGR03936 family radical SAM-associated protein [Candidatus Ratteibacteria bacterium]